MAAEPSSFIGRVIDNRYLVESVIGQGGMGVVLRARHKFTSAQVAIKMLNREVRLNAEVQDRFLAEARTPSAIGHPGIVQVLDAGSTPEGELYFAMELLTGRTLRQALYPSVPPQVARRVSLELLDALGAAHAHGIIHRDLKPENVFLINPAGTVKLLDFGIAKAIQTARTQQGQMLGTLAYMSPEQLMDASSVDPRADLWAVGVMLYEMLCGKLPFRASGLVEMVEAFNSRDADPIRIHLPPTTPWLDKADTFFTRALARDRTQRFRSTQEVAAGITALGLDDTHVPDAGSTITGMMASHDHRMTAADSGPRLPRSAAGMPAQNLMTAADSGPSLPRTGSSPIAQPHGTPSTPYTSRGTQQGSAVPASVRPSAPSAPHMVPTMPAPSSPHMVPTMPVPPAPQLFGVSNRPVAPTMPGAGNAPRNRSPSAPQMIPPGGSPSAPYAVPPSGSPSAPYVPASAPPIDRPSQPNVPVAGPSAPYAVPQSGSPSAPYGVPQSGSPSAPYAVPSGSPSAPYAVPPSGSPSAPYVPASAPPNARPSSRSAPPPYAQSGGAYGATPNPTGPGTWSLPPPPATAVGKGSSSLGKSSWIVLGVVAVAFVGLVVVLMRMNSDQGSAVEKCVEKCKPFRSCGKEGATSLCEAACTVAPTKATECIQTSGNSCDTFRSCALPGAP